MHMLALTLTPSVCVGVNEALDIPKTFKIQLQSGTAPSKFWLPEVTEEKKEAEAKRVSCFFFVSRQICCCRRLRVRLINDDDNNTSGEDRGSLVERLHGGEGEEEGRRWGGCVFLFPTRFASRIHTPLTSLPLRRTNVAG